MYCHRALNLLVRSVAVRGWKMSDLKPQAKLKIQNRFGFHKVDDKGALKMTTIRKKVRELATLIEEHCPNSSEKDTAFTQLQFVMMSANSAIVQEYPLDPKDFE